MSLLGADSVIKFGGSDFDEAQTGLLTSILKRLDSDIDAAISSTLVPRGIVRSTSPCVTYVLVNSTDIYVVAKKTDVVSSNVFTTVTEGRHSADAIHSFAILEMGLDDPIVFQIDRTSVETSPNSLRPDFHLQALAVEYVRGEQSRMQRAQNLINISPVFGNIEHSIQNDLCFVIGPFASEPTGTYISIIKPAVESVGLVCRRADEMFTNRAIMSDIWRSICESRVVVADLTGGNPNVYYELGIAHTLGKETILLSSDSGDKIPFDIQGIRQIRFQNSPAGGAALSDNLKKTLSSILTPDLSIG